MFTKIENSLLGILRKRRRLDQNQDQEQTSQTSNASTTNPYNWDSLFRANDSNEIMQDNSTSRDANDLHSNVVQLQMDRVVNVLDQLDARVERFRKDALGLQEKRDFLLMSIDLIKSNDLMANMSESEHDEVSCYIQRINSRLSTVEINVRTVRDNSQEDSLSQINALIDMMITLGDPVHSRHRCQEYLNSCGIVDANAPQTIPEESNSSSDVFVMDDGPVDKVFESALLGCTLDDQKIIKKRLQALMRYLNNQTIRN